MSPKSCLACGSQSLVGILNLGSTPLANSLARADQTADLPCYPLNVACCASCSMVQITDVVPPEQLFSTYPYFSSFSDTMLRHAHEEAQMLRDRRRLDQQSLVIEIASNDGYLLKSFVEQGIPVLGIEPAANIAKVAAEKGVRTLCEFFSLPLAHDLASKGIAADVMLANNVMAHIPDINGVLAGVRILLKPTGVFVMETPYVRNLIDRLEFDTIYHEHIFYYSLTSLRNLLARNGLTIADVEQVPIHGGSLRVFIVRADSPEARTPSGEVERILDEERESGVASPAYYQGFESRVRSLRDNLIKLLLQLRSSGKRIAAYGASAKGSTLLNYCGIGTDLIDFVADRSTVKQGLYTPGTHLPICNPARLLEVMPDYVLLLTWNFADEILVQQAEYRGRGGKFIIPVPDARIV